MPVERVGVLFVCMGNICRSPLARVIFEKLVADHGLSSRFEIDSCGTSAWHVGNPADARSVQVAAKHGLDLTHSARKLDPDSDFERFHHLLGMDQSNCATMLEWGAPRDRVRLVRSFDPWTATRPEHELDVPDPYYGGDDGFDKVYEMLSRSCEGLLAHLR
ncbi:MAG: low molecular weight protein-tyrosine-phosphatase [Phycisphaerales bacterium]